MGTKPLSKICKLTITPRVTSLPIGSYTLLRKEKEEEVYSLPDVDGERWSKIKTEMLLCSL